MMNHLTPFLHNTESLLYYPARRLNYVLLVATLIHLFFLFAININPIMQALHLKSSNRQLAVSLTLIEDAPPELAQYIGPKNHRGTLEDTNEVRLVEANNKTQTVEKYFNLTSTSNSEPIIALQNVQRRFVDVG